MSSLLQYGTLLLVQLLVLFVVLVAIGDGAVDIKLICNTTSYPDSCYNSLATIAAMSRGHHEVYRLSVQVASEELSRASDGFLQLQEEFKNISDAMSLRAVQVCHDLFSIAARCLTDSWSVALDRPANIHDAFADLNIWLTAAGTHQHSCVSAMDDAKDSTLRRKVLKNLEKSIKLTSNSLAILRAFQESMVDRSKVNTEDQHTVSASAAKRIGLIRESRKLGSGGMPRWMDSKERRWLRTPTGNLQIDAVVAKDGSGEFSKICDALKAVPDNCVKRFVVYVKRGVYNENVRVEATKSNVMMIGEGMEATVVSAALNFVDGTPTFDTATFCVFGAGFIARDMGFQNTAGAAKRQAIALMADGDRGVFYRCKFDGFQDTLLAHAYRQFFRHCHIYGTVDFIFGDAAAVFQDCNILPRRPLPGQQNIITAQGKTDSRGASGFSIQDCKLYPAENLAGATTFLGRPWKTYSTTVFIRTYMGSFIHPKGWVPFRGTMAPDSIYYAEFENQGPGAVTANRVQWKGLHLDISSAEANNFTANSLIRGGSWLPSTGVPFKSGL
nr:probable pectinesterase/pectinesterase inhibitor 46 [Ipomoea batatas]